MDRAGEASPAVTSFFIHPCREDSLVHLEIAWNEHLPTVAVFGSSLPQNAQAAEHFGLTGDHPDIRRQCARHRHVGVERRISKHPPEMGRVMADHGYTGRASFEEDHTKALGERCQHEKVGGDQKLRNPDSGNSYEAVAARKKLCRQVSQSGSFRSRLARHAQKNRILAQGSNFPNQVIQSLVAAIESGDRQNNESVMWQRKLVPRSLAAQPWKA